MKLEYMLY